CGAEPRVRKSAYTPRINSIPSSKRLRPWSFRRHWPREREQIKDEIRPRSLGRSLLFGGRKPWHSFWEDTCRSHAAAFRRRRSRVVDTFVAVDDRCDSGIANNAEVSESRR